MNKKMYIAPETTCIAIEAEKMLAASAETTVLGISGDTADADDFASREDNSTRPTNNNPWDQAW